MFTEPKPKPKKIFFCGLNRKTESITDNGKGATINFKDSEQVSW